MYRNEILKSIKEDEEVPPGFVGWDSVQSKYVKAREIKFISLKKKHSKRLFESVHTSPQHENIFMGHSGVDPDTLIEYGVEEILAPLTVRNASDACNQMSNTAGEKLEEQHNNTNGSFTNKIDYDHIAHKVPANEEYKKLLRQKMAHLSTGKEKLFFLYQTLKDKTYGDTTEMETYTEWDGMAATSEYHNISDSLSCSSDNVIEQPIYGQSKTQKISVRSRNSLMSRLNPFRIFSKFKLGWNISKRCSTVDKVKKVIFHEGSLIRFPSAISQETFTSQKCNGSLSESEFTTCTKPGKVLDSISLDQISVFQYISNHSTADISTQIYCFEIWTCDLNHSDVGIVGKENQYIYGVKIKMECIIWMKKLLEKLTDIFPPKYTNDFNRAGCCYLKTCTYSNWRDGWILLNNEKRLLVVNEMELDLRKAHRIELIVDETALELYIEHGPVLMIDCPPFKTFIALKTLCEAYNWYRTIREVAHNNGLSLHEQQLTKFNVPVIIDKCTAHVFVYGSLKEDIYRKISSQAHIIHLKDAFCADAFNVEISQIDCTVFDVANFLKYFIAKLPETLIGRHTESFIEASKHHGNFADVVKLYKGLLERLTTIEYATLMHLVGHLKSIATQKAKSKMSIRSLNYIWSPVLLDPRTLFFGREYKIIVDLCVLYRHIFPVDDKVASYEQAILDLVIEYYATAESTIDVLKEPSGIHVWIHLNTFQDDVKNEECFAYITVNRETTVKDALYEISERMHLPAYKITLSEVILDGSLERPLHHHTKLFSIFVNWSCWSKDDREYNYLIAKPTELLMNMQRIIGKLETMIPSTVIDFYDSGTETHKSLHCELRDNTVVISRQDKDEEKTLIREINLHDSIAYLGYANKLYFPFNWAITFVEHIAETQIECSTHPSSYNKYVLAGVDKLDGTIWLSMLWHSLYGKYILPVPPP